MNLEELEKNDREKDRNYSIIIYSTMGSQRLAAFRILEDGDGF